MVLARSIGRAKQMANKEDHLAILQQGVETWNIWREETPDTHPRPDLRMADLREANLSEADLRRAYLGGADLSEANLDDAILYETILANLDLSSCKGLERCVHRGPSIIDYRTLQRSGPLPLAFLRGVSLPDNLIDYLPSLLNQPLQFYSCFISYSSKDQPFADRLHAGLQAKGVRCWFAPHDLPIGAKILDAIDEAIRLRDKVLGSRHRTGTDSR
jgi:TIR domain/Pentapeptide repeats (8 copies)